MPRVKKTKSTITKIFVPLKKVILKKEPSCVEKMKVPQCEYVGKRRCIVGCAKYEKYCYYHLIYSIPTHIVDGPIPSPFPELE